MRDVGAVVLSGGAAVRLDGADKGSVEVGGRTLLDRVLDALLDVPDVVVVGPQVRTERPVTFRREQPPGGGPAAGLAAGLTGFVRLPSVVLALAVDLPFLAPGTIGRLVSAATARGVDGARLLDPDGRHQHLCAAYDGPRLSAACAGDVHGSSMGALLRGLVLADVPAEGDEARDVDTWEDLRAVRSRIED